MAGLSKGLAAASVLAVLLAPSIAAAQAQKAGVAAAVAGSVTRTKAAAASRDALASGAEMFMQDKVDSGANSRAQIVLLDETVFTVGPSSSVTIDEFVFDPASGAGKVTANIAGGMFRYVSGKVAKAQPDNVQLKVQGAGTIGIRGTNLFGIRDPETGNYFVGLLGPGLDNDGLMHRGGFTLTNATGTHEVRRPGFGTMIGRDGSVSIIRIPPALLNAMRGQLGQATGQGPTRAASAGGATLNVSANVQGAVGSQGAALAADTAAGAMLIEQQAMVANEQAMTAAQETATATHQPVQQVVTDRLLGYGDAIPDGVALPWAIQLNWNTNAVGDLDLHLTGPNPDGASRFHVYYGNLGSFGNAPYARLENDVTTSGTVGSEIIAINGLTPGQPYHAFVFNYSDQSTTGNTLSTVANASVKIIQNGLIQRGASGSSIISGTVVGSATPSQGAVGNTWQAATIDPSTRNVTTYQHVTNTTSGFVQ